jgi:hypothetical protein
MVTIVAGSGITVARVKLDDIEAPFLVNAKVTSAGAAVNPTNDPSGVNVPVRSTNKAFVVSLMIMPPVATKDPNMAFEMEKPPPVPTVVSVRLYPPNDVPTGTIAKSPFPALEVTESVAVNVVDVMRFVEFSATPSPAKGIDPLISSACKTVVQILIVASRNRRRVEFRRLIVKPPRESAVRFGTKPQS